MKCHLLSQPIFLDEKGQAIAAIAIVSAVNSRAFLGWLYGQVSLEHSRLLQVKSAQILVGRSLGKMSMALMLFLVRKNMPISMTEHYLNRVSSTIAAGFLLGLYGSRFGALVWGRRVALDIAALILGVFR
jgi:hypothetical protein